MPRIICVANQKGGVGKTTTAINLSVGLAIGGCRTLLIDLDPQGNATTGLGHAPIDRHPLLTQDPSSSVMSDVTTAGLDVMPGSLRFDDARTMAHGDLGAIHQISQYFADDLESYEFVLMDCPPSLGPLTEAALACSTEVMMPIQCEYFAMEGLTQMIEVIRRVMRQPNSQLEFGGIVLTMYDHTSGTDPPRWKAEVREIFLVISFSTTVIPRDVSVSRSTEPRQFRSCDYAPQSTWGTGIHRTYAWRYLERV